MGYPADNIVDENGYLTEAYSSSLGTHGWEIGDSLPSTYLLPDLDHDNDMDTQDFALFQSYWTSQNTLADFNNDSIINAQDFAIMMSTWESY